MKHQTKSIVMITHLICGNCGLEFKESNDLKDPYDSNILQDGDWVECSKCNIELEINSENSEDEEEYDEENY